MLTTVAGTWQGLTRCPGWYSSLDGTSQGKCGQKQVVGGESSFSAPEQATGIFVALVPLCLPEIIATVASTAELVKTKHPPCITQLAWIPMTSTNYLVCLSHGGVTGHASR